jgi:hypothetical protein
MLSDPDKNATLEYYLEPNELMEVEPTNGILRLKRTWHRQLNAQSRACVSGKLFGLSDL